MAHDPCLSWADSVEVFNGYVYVTLDGRDLRVPPYLLVRVAMGADPVMVEGIVSERGDDQCAVANSRQQVSIQARSESSAMPHSC
jgi:hypothetical protein